MNCPQERTYLLARNPKLARDTVTWLCVEREQEACTSPWPDPRILDAAGVISLHQAVLGNPIPLGKKILDDVEPAINIGPPTAGCARRAASLTPDAALKFPQSLHVGPGSGRSKLRPRHSRSNTEDRVCGRGRPGDICHRGLGARPPRRSPVILLCTLAAPLNQIVRRQRCHHVLTGGRDDDGFHALLSARIAKQG